MFLFYKEMWRRKDLYRIFMNKQCEQHTIRGQVLDVGSGIAMASYHRFLRKEMDIVVECLDLGFENSNAKKINLEADFLPQANESMDTVLLFNVLEHLYNYQFVLSEAKRVLKPGGKLIGATPFLVAYHPDPHDFWRYTKDALEKIFKKAGFNDIQIISFGYGPMCASFSQMEVILPRIFKIILLPIFLLCDWIIIKLKPKMNKDKFPLGLFFVVK